MPAASAGRHLFLATFSFGLSFMAWGLVSAFAPRFRQDLGLSGTQTALLVAVPVLLVAVARVPVGMLADRPPASKARKPDYSTRSGGRKAANAAPRASHSVSGTRFAGRR
jgi:MFS family permease